MLEYTDKIKRKTKMYIKNLVSKGIIFILSLSVAIPANLSLNPANVAHADNGAYEVNVALDSGDEDDGDANPGDGRCDINADPAEENCTLRAAIEESNADGVDSTVTVAEGITGTLNLTSSLPTASQPITITGPGMDDFLIDGGVVNEYSTFTFGTDADDSNLSGFDVENCASGFGCIAAVGDGAVTDNVHISYMRIGGFTGGRGANWEVDNNEFIADGTYWQHGAADGSGLNFHHNSFDCTGRDVFWAFLVSSSQGDPYDSVTISNNAFENCNDVAYSITANVKIATIEYNTITNSGLIDIELAESETPYGDDYYSSISHNEITGATAAGNVIRVHSDEVIDFLGYTTVSDNTINNSAGNGIDLTNLTSVEVGRNTITNQSWAGIVYNNSSSCESPDNVISGAETGILFETGSSENLLSRATITDSVNYGVMFSTDTPNNYIDDSTITGSTVADIRSIDPEEINVNYINNTDFETYETAGGTFDVNFAPHVRNLLGNLVAVTPQSTITATPDVGDPISLDTTEGVAAFDGDNMLDGYEITSDGIGNIITYVFTASTNVLFGDPQEDEIEVALDTQDQEVDFNYNPVFYASYTPISIDETDYNDRLVYGYALTGDGTTVAEDNTEIPLNPWEAPALSWATVQITGGAHLGENWTLVLWTDVFSEESDITDWLNQFTDVGEGNFTITNEFLDENYMSTDGASDYTFALPEGTIVASDGTDPGYLTLGESDFYANNNIFNYDGTALDYIMYPKQYLFGKTAGMGETPTQNTPIPDADGVNDFDIMTISAEGLYTGSVGFLYRTDLYATLESLTDMIDSIFVDQGWMDTYEVIYESVADEHHAIVANGETNNYSFDLPEGFTFAGDDPANLVYGLATPNPSVTLSANTNTISEAGATSTITATLSEISALDITVNLAFSGTATLDADYATSADSITITAGQLTGTATVTAIDDETEEDDETIIVDIDSVLNGVEDGTQQEIITITDNDEPPAGDDDDDDDQGGGYYIDPSDDDTADDDAADDDIIEDDTGEELPPEDAEEPDVEIEIEIEIEKATETVTDLVFDPEETQNSELVDVLTTYEDTTHESPEDTLLSPTLPVTNEGKNIEKLVEGGKLTDEEKTTVEEYVSGVLEGTISDALQSQGAITLYGYDNINSKSIEVIYSSLYTASELARLIKEIEAEGKTALVIDNNTDLDNDGMPDVLQIAYGMNMFVNEGLSNADALYLGGKAGTRYVCSKLPYVTNVNGLTLGSTPSFRIAGCVGDNVELFIVPADSYDGANDDFVEDMSLGSTEIDAGYKGELSAKYSIPNGIFYVIPKGEEGYGKPSKFVVNNSVDKEQSKPEILAIENSKMKQSFVYDLGLFVRIPLDVVSAASDGKFETKQYIASLLSEPTNIQIIRGKAKPGTHIFITMRSVVFSSVVISDAKGNFQVNVATSNLDLQNEEHSITAYSSSSLNKTMGSATNVRTIKSKVVK